MEEARCLSSLAYLKSILLAAMNVCHNMAVLVRCSEIHACMLCLGKKYTVAAQKSVCHQGTGSFLLRAHCKCTS